MVRLIYILFFIFITSCRKNAIQDLPINLLKSEYFNSEIDSFYFAVYGKNPFNIIDTEIWKKTLDYSPTSNNRTIKYKINSKKNNSQLRYFIIEPNGLKTTSNLSVNNYFLSVYKSYLLDETSQKIYEERDGKYIRYFYSKKVQINTNYYSGYCIWSSLKYSTIQNDSMFIRTVIDEYYALNKGLIYIKQKDSYFNNNLFISDTSIYKYRY